MYEKIKINKKKITILFALTLLVGFYFIFFPSFQVPMSSSDEGSNEIKSSGIYPPISIDDLPSSSTDWSWAETQPWFGGGSGTPGDPYILENLIIDGGGTDSCIFIQNSIRHFIIKNCTLYNAGTNEAGILFNNVTNSQINGNNVSNNAYYGIAFKGSHNNTIYKNIVNDNIGKHGIYLGGCQNNTILNNYAVNNGEYGIALEQSMFNFLSENSLNNNTNSGIWLLDSSNDNTLFENDAYYNGNNGIYCVDSINNVIENTIAHYNTHNGIYLQNSHNTSIINNELSDSVENGIKMEGSYENWIEGTTANDNGHNGIFNIVGDFNTFKDTIALDNGYNGIYCGSGDFNLFEDTLALRNGHNGIYLFDSDNCSTLDNHLSNSTENGLKIEYSDENWIEGTTANDNGYDGIYIGGSDFNIFKNTLALRNGHNGVKFASCLNNNIEQTIANENTYNGIYLFDTNETEVTDTSASDNSYNGIFLQYSNDNTIKKNILFENNENGLKFLDLCKNNLAYSNTLYNNELHGLLIQVNSNNNVIYDNLIYNNSDKGILIETDDNFIFANFLLRNMIHALDSGSSNDWIGNYWDNWTSPDADLDGIVDNPYIFIQGSAGSIDLEPIAEDGAPWILINLPNNHDVFGIDAPDYSVAIIDDYLSEMWYTVDGGLNNFTFTEFSGIIDETTWDLLPDGSYTLTFYASDKVGNIGFSEIEIKKDTQAPSINIISPTSVDIFITAPSFIVTILDENLDTMWYSLDGGLTNYTFNSNSTINQAGWNILPEGQVTITFYARDILGRLTFASVSFTKTSGTDPIIMVIIIGSTIGGAVVLIGVFMYLRKRRKPKIE